MSINRNNYEEYFILYMDNELSSDDRRMVDVFVQHHPDLKEELEILLQYKLVPDPSVTYAGKEDLMKINGNTPVNISNYEEWLTLYIDNELPETDRKAVEQLIAANPAVQHDLDLFLKSKLEPEKIVFSDRRLYREEERVRRMPVYWWRVAAAVLILALGIASLLVINNRQSRNEDVADVTPAEQKQNKPELLRESREIPEQVAVSEEKEIRIPFETKQQQNQAPSLSKEDAQVAKKSNTSELRLKNRNIPEEYKKEEIYVAEVKDKPSNNLPQPENIKSNENVVARTEKQVVPKEFVNPNTLTNVTNNTADPSDKVIAAAHTDNVDDLDQSSGKKNKLRGFFRKMTRTFEKRTNIDPTDEDEKLLVGGLAIKLK